MNIGRWVLHCFTALLFVFNFPVHAQSKIDYPVKELRDVLTVDATVTAMIQPDTAVIVLAVDRQGADVAPLTQEINQTLARALAEAKATKGVVASTGAYATNPRYDNKGQRTGWMVRAELVLKAKEFVVLGTLVGKLSKEMQIASNSAEISIELRDKEEALLIERGIATFRSKAQSATKAFGYSSYAVREVVIGQIGGGMPMQPKMAMVRGAMMAADAAPMPVEPGARDLSLTVSGSVQMVK